MTDNKIIKALECCRDCKCKDCPCYNKETGSCKELDEQDILDLINRLKAKNEEFDEKIVIQMGTIDWQAKEINRQKAEIERLNTMHSEMCIGMKVLKQKAIKEFAERLKQEAFECDVSFGYGKECYQQAVAVIEIDNLVKEMTEDENENH